MQTIDDLKFAEELCNENIDREFITLHLLALSTKSLQYKIVSKYNKTRYIGDDDIVLNKVIRIWIP